MKNANIDLLMAVRGLRSSHTKSWNKKKTNMDCIIILTGCHVNKVYSFCKEIGIDSKDYEI